MITRLKINGFKNLIDFEVHFGVFNCIAGANAVGKSNLFDAICFLSDLSHKSLLDAALSVRSEGQRNQPIQELFSRTGQWQADRMELEADMLVAEEATDELGQKAKASITSLKYSLVLVWNNEENKLKIAEEWLEPISLTETEKRLYFKPHKNWKNSVLKGRRNSNTPFISTATDGSGEVVIQIHNDKVSGPPLKRKANVLSRSILSTAYSAQHPTVVVAQQEMRSWKMLHLESSSLRRSDELHQIAQAHLTENGLHLPATVYRLQRDQKDRDIYQLLANRLANLIGGISELNIDLDPKRELLTLMLHFKNGETFSARSLSDGTLRFLGLAVMELDKDSGSLICLEEPENGIHPKRIPDMLDLLQDLACDTELPMDETNPLRQVIINTHSPHVVQLVPEDSLLIAHILQSDNRLVLKPLPKTWRSSIPGVQSDNLSKLLEYLQEPTADLADAELWFEKQLGKLRKRVLQRPDVEALKKTSLFPNLNTK